MGAGREEGRHQAAMIGWIARFACSAMFASAIAASPAEGYPGKPVRVIVSFPPGAGPDIVARTVGQKLAERWGQPVLVDNRPGAGGNIATEMLAKAPPDGCTLIMLSNHLAINPGLFREVAYDPIANFAPVTLATWTPNVLVVHPSLPVKTVKELMGLARRKPGDLNFSSGGNGSVGHLAGELFKTRLSSAARFLSPS